MEFSSRTIVTIFGFGNVGRSIAHLLINMSDCTFTINVMDPSPNVKGSFLDLGHAARLTTRHKLVMNSEELLNISEYIFHSAGAGVPPGGSRLDLSEINCTLSYSMFKNYQPKVDAKVIVITNPVDNVAYHTHKATGLSASKVIGTGTLLDSLRMNYYLQQLKPSQQDINAILIGEHGASIVVAHSLSYVSGQRLLDYFTYEEIQICLQQTITAASEIKKTQGASIYGAADCAAYIMRQIMFDTGVVKPLGVLLPDEYIQKLDCSDMFMSLPARLTKNGVELGEVIELDENEWHQLSTSANVISTYN